MKVRMGFVSNSSSSSFCIYGISLERENFIDKIGEFNDEDDITEILEKTFPGLETWYDCGNDVVFIGLSIDEMEDNQTKKEFQNFVEQKIIQCNKKFNNSADWFLETIET